MINVLKEVFSTDSNPVRDRQNVFRSPSEQTQAAAEHRNADELLRFAFGPPFAIWGHDSGSPSQTGGSSLVSTP
jgi:hypothetical protein